MYKKNDKLRWIKIIIIQRIIFYNMATKHMNYFQLKIKHENIEQKQILTLSCISSLKFKVTAQGNVWILFFQTNMEYL